MKKVTMVFYVNNKIAKRLEKFNKEGDAFLQMWVFKDDNGYNHTIEAGRSFWSEGESGRFHDIKVMVE